MLTARAHLASTAVVFLAITGDLIFTSAASSWIGNALAAILVGLAFLHRKSLAAIRLEPVALLSFVLLVLWLSNLMMRGASHQAHEAPWGRIMIIPIYALFLGDAFFRFVKAEVFEYALLAVLGVNLLVFSFGGASSGIWGDHYVGFDSRFSGSSLNPNTLAVLLSLTILIISLKMTDQSVFGASVTILLVIAAAFLIIQTASKKGIVLVALFLPLSLAVNADRKTIKKWTIGVGSAAMAFYGAWIALLNSEYSASLDYILTRFELFLAMDDSSTVDRLKWVQLGLQGLFEKPFQGHGPFAFAAHHGVYSHNNYIELLYNGGIPAFVIYYSMHAHVVKKTCTLLVGAARNRVLLIVLALLVMDLAMVSYDQTLAPIVLLYCVALVREAAAKPALEPGPFLQ